MVNHNVSLLHAIYMEYGLETFIKRLKKIYNIEISIVDGLTIAFLPNQIVVNYLKGEQPESVISFENDYYQHIKYFKEYFVTTRYDNDHNKFERIFSFYTKDHHILVLDELDAVNIKCRRLIKTTEEDKDLLYGEYEKAQRIYLSPDAIENYTFKNNSGNVEIKKVIGMSNGLYYFSYKSSKTIPTVGPISNILEVSSTTNVPYLNTIGRTRNNNELLIESVRHKIPNILIRGALISATSPKTFYKISILKTEKGITIHYLSSDSKAENPFRKIIAVPIQINGELTLTEIDNIIIAIRNNITKELEVDFNSQINIESIIAELLSIKDEIQINKKAKLKNPDIIDFKLNQFDRIEQLAFDIYENISNYERYINNSPNDKNPTLKKEN